MDHALWQGDAERFLGGLPTEPLFDLIVTSPPYNIGKEYETRTGLEKYLEWQERIIDGLIPRLKPGDRKSTRLNSSHERRSRMPSSA